MQFGDGGLESGLISSSIRSAQAVTAAGAFTGDVDDGTVSSSMVHAGRRRSVAADQEGLAADGDDAQAGLVVEGVGVVMMPR
jgi:hypothetical protein